MVGCMNVPISESTKFTVEDALERTLEFSEYPERIVIAGKQTPMLANFFYLFDHLFRMHIKKNFFREDFWFNEIEFFKN